jgi:hypothetical protein
MDDLRLVRFVDVIFLNLANCVICGFGVWRVHKENGLRNRGRFLFVF